MHFLPIYSYIQCETIFFFLFYKKKFYKITPCYITKKFTNFYKPLMLETTSLNVKETSPYKKLQRTNICSITHFTLEIIWTI